MPVTIGAVTIDTDVNGQAVFGSGYASGTYTIEWEWCDGHHSETVTIDCTQRDWCYDYDLVNPEVHKTFFVDTEYGPYPAAEGLEVTLVGYGSQMTDVNGYVAWIVDYPFTDTTLEWTWNGVADSEPVLWSQFVDCVWTGRNPLEPKSGGG